MINTYIDILKKTQLFSDIDENDILCILECLRTQVCKYTRNEHIMNLDDRINKFGIIIDGEVITLKEGPEGNRAIISIIKVGDIFGGAFVFSDLDSWPVSVISKENCTIMFFEDIDSIYKIKDICSCYTQLLQNFISILSNKSLLLSKRIEYLSIRSVRDKIATYILDQYYYKKGYNIYLSLNRNELADFLNISRPSLSREICKMRDEGIIDFYLSTFRIKDIEALKKNLPFQ
ncbi:TPA: Crp/Fnr family transcriptional regulator [Clostridioides difficile]|nr:Crp/Fnr family transcriptional regulator [Clostridioides difficile]HDJ1470934.1 Crp/Fnr family transcriptional regulator [Clostridioides difficile]